MGTAKDQEKALVRRLVRMEGGAWEAFCREYARPLLGFVEWSFGCSREQAEDVVQMTFVRCVKSIRTFNPAMGGLFGWLKAVARNEAHTCLRKDLRNPADVALSAVPPRVADEMLSTLDSRSLPDALLARKDVRLAIQETLMRMNPRHREVLILKYVDGLKVATIASRLGSSEKAVESLLSRSRESFRGLFRTRIPQGDPETAEMPQ